MIAKSKLAPPRGIWPWPEWVAEWSTGERSGACYEHTRERAIEKAKAEAEESLTCDGCGTRDRSQKIEVTAHRVGAPARIARGLGWRPCLGCRRGCKHYKEDFVSCCLGQNKLFRLVLFVYRLAERGDEAAMEALGVEISE